MQAAGKTAAPISEDETQVNDLKARIRETAAWLPEYTNNTLSEMAADNPALYRAYTELTSPTPLPPHIRPLLTIIPAILYKVLNSQHPQPIKEQAIQATMRQHQQDGQWHTEKNLDELHRLCPKLYGLLYQYTEPFLKITPQAYKGENELAETLTAIIFAAYLSQSIEERLEAMWERPVR